MKLHTPTIALISAICVPTLTNDSGYTDEYVYDYERDKAPEQVAQLDYEEEYGNSKVCYYSLDGQQFELEFDLDHTCTNEVYF